MMKFPPRLAWLLDINLAIDLSTRDWRQKQMAVRNLPRWSKEPTEAVKRVFEWCRIPLEERQKTNNMKMPATDTEIEEVRLHLMADPVAFIWHFAYYRNRDGARREVATPTDGQLVILWRFTALIRAGVPVRIALLKVRQGGFSWLIVNLCAWLICFHKLMDGISAAQDADTTRRTFRYLKDAYDMLPEAFRPQQQHSTRSELILRNPKGSFGNLGQESSLICQTAGKDSLGTGFPLQICHFSETGKWDKVCNTEDTVTSVMGSIQNEPFTFIVDESTAKGHGSYWWRKYHASKKHGQDGWNGYTAIFIPWFFDHRNSAKKVPEDFQPSTNEDSQWGNEQVLIDRFNVTPGQLVWRRRRIQGYEAISDQRGRSPKDLFRQEYPSDDVEAWLLQGGTWLEPEEVERIRRFTAQAENAGHHVVKWRGKLDPQRALGPRVSWGSDQILTYQQRGHLIVYRYPDESQDYIIGGDVAGNTQLGDASSAKVYQRVGYADEGYSLMRIAASFHGQIDEDDFGDFLWRLGWLYSTRMGDELLPALLAWERTGVGNAMSKFIRPKRDSMLNMYPQNRLFADHMMGKKVEKAGNTFGIATSHASKPVMLGVWKSSAKRGEILVDAETLAEAASLSVDEESERVDTKGKDHFMASVMANYAAGFVSPLVSIPARPAVKMIPNTVGWLIEKERQQQQEGEDDEYY